MTKFEIYLLSIGFVCHRRIRTGKDSMEWTPATHTGFSTMVTCQYKYIHPNGQECLFGLNEKDRPPTIISPRPNTIVKLSNSSKYVIIGYVSDFIIGGLLNDKSPEEVFSIIFDPNYVFELDLDEWLVSLAGICNEKTVLKIKEWASK